MPFENQINDHIATIKALKPLMPQILAAAEQVIACLENDGKVLWAGNGGSAADSQHLAAELVGRYLHQRNGLASVALTTDTSILTAVANDFGFDQVFARQVEALARPGDVLFALSTSGNSANIMQAVKVAASRKVVTIGMSGNDGGQLADIADINLIVPSHETARIQEAHILIGHLVCEHVDIHFQQAR